MRRSGLGITLVCICTLAVNATYAKPSKISRGIEFSDEAVERAVEGAKEYLWSARAGDGIWPAYHKSKYPLGPTALAAYALMESGVSPRDPRMKKVLTILTARDTKETYVLGLRANAYLAAIKQHAPEYVEHLRKDVALLVKSAKNGSYHYVSNGTQQKNYDNSNSQYGLLGVWAGAQAQSLGISIGEISEDYWQKAMRHWSSQQKGDGGCGYRKDHRSSATMTAAWVASMFVCFDNLYAKEFIRCAGGGTDQHLQKMQKGLDWLGSHFEGSLRGRWLFYFLYGAERVGLAAGHKYFGDADWYKSGASFLIRTQRADGSWFVDRPVVDTAFALLFLIRGRQPVVLNKLQFQGDWNNRPRDCAYLARWMSSEFEKNVSWQIVNLDVPVEEWHDAPIIYLSASRAPQFSESDLAKLRAFVWQGGTILSVTECDGSGFRDGMRDVYRKLFPTYKLTACEPEHTVYTLRRYKLRGHPKLEMITNGIRPLAIHTDVDLSKNWQLQRLHTNKWAFEIAANAYIYITDATFTNRGVRTWPAEPDFAGTKTVKLARLKHDGNCDPEPLAYQRLARLMSEETQVVLQVAGPIAISELPASGAQVATMTGTEKFELSAEETKTLMQFVMDGGILVIDAAGGSREFDKSAGRFLRTFAHLGPLSRLPQNSLIYKLPGHEIEKIRYRFRTQARMPKGRGNLQAVMVFGRPGVIYSREDITAALVNYPAYTCDGYHPETAYKLMRNIILYAAGQ
ncbi:MAG: DUF4159 domain-containing protein [Planctomycetota bacterium]|jgi:hypothetical protein